MLDGDASVIPLGPCEPLLCPTESYHLGYPGFQGDKFLAPKKFQPRGKGKEPGIHGPVVSG